MPVKNNPQSNIQINRNLWTSRQENLQAALVGATRHPRSCLSATSLANTCLNILTSLRESTQSSEQRNNQESVGTSLQGDTNLRTSIQSFYETIKHQYGPTEIYEYLWKVTQSNAKPHKATESNSNQCKARERNSKQHKPLQSNTYQFKPTQSNAKQRKKQSNTT